MLHDTIQAALRAANNRADKTVIKIIKRVPGIVRRYVPNDQAGTFITSVFQSMGQHYLSVHGMVMSQVVVPFHIARGTYNTSGNMFRAVNHVVPGLSAAAANYRAAPPALSAGPGQSSTSQIQISEETREVPLQDTPTGRPGKQGRSEMSTPIKSVSNKQSSGKAPLMAQSLRDFKSKESKIQTGGTPGSKRGSGKKEAKLDSAEIAKAWDGFEREDVAHDAARRVLHMNPTTGGKALSLSDHEDHSIEILTERDAPSRDEASSRVNRKRKEETSSDKMKHARLDPPVARRGRRIRWKNRTCSTVISKDSCPSARSRQPSRCPPTGQQAQAPARLRSGRMTTPGWVVPLVSPRSPKIRTRSPGRRRAPVVRTLLKRNSGCRGSSRRKLTATTVLLCLCW